jgi:hypothetical protein
MGGGRFRLVQYLASLVEGGLVVAALAKRVSNEKERGEIA